MAAEERQSLCIAPLRQVPTNRQEITNPRVSIGPDVGAQARNLRTTIDVAGKSGPEWWQA